MFGLEKGALSKRPFFVQNILALALLNPQFHLPSLTFGHGGKK